MRDSLNMQIYFSVNQEHDLVPRMAKYILARYLERHGKLTSDYFSIIGYEWVGSKDRADDRAGRLTFRKFCNIVASS